MPENVENSAVATGLVKFSFYSNPKERQCQRMFKFIQHCMIELISHTSKVMLKILQDRLQQYVNCELPDVQSAFRKDRGQHPLDDRKSKRVPEKKKKSTSAFLTTPKLLTVWITKKLWKILKEVEISDHPACLLSNLYTGQEATVKIGHGTTDWFQIRKGVHQDCILSVSLFNSYAGYIMQNSGWMKHKLESRLPGELSITSHMYMAQSLWQKAKRN